MICSRARSRVSPSALGLFCVLGLGVSCVGTETGNPVTSQTMALTVRSSAAEVALASGEERKGARLVVEEVWIVLGDVRFVRSEACDRGPSQRADIEGPNVFELVLAPDPLPFAVPEGTYCRVRVRLDRTDDLPSAAPAELEDHSVLLRGRRADGVPFVLRSRAQREADVRSKGQPFSLAEAHESVILAFDVGLWLAGLDLASATPDARGVVRIDEDDNRDLLEVFEDRLEAALELFRDEDRDGKLSEREAKSKLASGAP